MNSKPSLGLFVHLVHNLKDGAFFQEIIANFALQISQHLEEF